MNEEIFSVLIGTSPCNHCDSENEWYFEEMEDGSIRIGYSGCGGYMGRAWREKGKRVAREEAVARLQKRIEYIEDERMNLLKHKKEAEAMLNRLRPPSSEAIRDLMARFSRC